MLQRLRQSADPDSLLKQLCFHGIEGRYVGPFEQSGTLTGEAHHQKSETIAGHPVSWQYTPG